MRLENKHLRWHYSVAAILFTMLIIGFLVFKGQNELNFDGHGLEILKIISYLSTFVGIPFAYGWYKTVLKPKDPDQAEEDNWTMRFYVFSGLAFFNGLLFILTFDRSLMFVMIITMSVYLLNKPRLENK